MKNVSLLLTVLAILFFGNVHAQEWKLDESHSSIDFEIKHFFTPVKGSFDEFSGVLIFDPANLNSSKTEFTVQVASVNTKNDKRDKHLQSNDFFNANQWPTMKFASTRFEKKSGNEYLVHGKLTIRDKTRQVALPFTVLGIQDHPMKKNKQLIGIRSEFSLDRTDYGVGAGSWAANAVVGDEVNATVLFEAVK